MVEDCVIVDEGVKKRRGGSMGDEEKRAKDQRLKSLFNSEEKRGILTGPGIIVGKEIDGNDSGEKNVKNTDC